MKKLFTGIALLFLPAAGAVAQVSVDLSIRITSPQPDAIITCYDDLTISYTLKNNGPDPIDLTGADSTIIVGIQGTMDSTFSLGGQDMISFDTVGKFALGVDEEMTGQTVTRKVKDIFRVWKYPIEPGTSPEIYRENVRSGRFVLYIETLGFIDRVTRQMAYNYNDEVDTNDIGYVVVSFDCGINVKEINAHTSALNVYPNPALSGVASFEFEFKGNETATVRVYDVTGRTVLTREVKGTGMQTVQVDVSSLNAGMYNMEIATADRRGVSKFTVAQ